MLSGFFRARPYRSGAPDGLVRKKAQRKALSFNLFAEREGFEPPDPLRSTVFKTAAFDHSAISPKSNVISLHVTFSVKWTAKISTFFEIASGWEEKARKILKTAVRGAGLQIKMITLQDVLKIRVTHKNTSNTQ